MKRSPKTMGLAVLAALAIGAVGASGAQGEETLFTHSEYPIAITGSDEGENNIYTLAGSEVECESISFEGTIEKQSGSLAVAPTYEECEDGSLGLASSWDLNGCQYLFTAGEATSEEDVHGTTDIVCPEGQQIEITVGTLCTVDIPVQEGLGGVTYTNVEADEQTPDDYVTVDLTLEDLHYTETDNSIFCPYTNEATREDGVFHAEIVLKGYEDGQEHSDSTLLDLDVKTVE